jgi:hypothetical protein
MRWQLRGAAESARVLLGTGPRPRQARPNIIAGRCWSRVHLCFWWAEISVGRLSSLAMRTRAGPANFWFTPPVLRAGGRKLAPPVLCPPSRRSRTTCCSTIALTCSHQWIRHRGYICLKFKNFEQIWQMTLDVESTKIKVTLRWMIFLFEII